MVVVVVNSNKKRSLRLVKSEIKPDAVSLDTSIFDIIPDEDPLEAMLDEVSDAEFGEVALKDAKPLKLKEWKAEEFASIYVRFRPHLERHARRFLTNPSQVDEVVQDAFLYLMVSLPELDSEVGVLRFLKWKVKNLCLDVYRAQGRAYINSIDDIAEPESTEPEVGSAIEQAEDAAIVRLALSKLNPRHREVLLASIYEEKTTEEIASQVGLSANATRQLMFRARAAFKQALLGDVDTEGMSMSAILSVAARKAGEEAKKVGAQAMVLVLFLALTIGAVLNFGSSSKSQSTTVAEAPAPESNSTEPVAETEPVIKTVVAKDVPLAIAPKPMVSALTEVRVEQTLKTTTKNDVGYVQTASNVSAAGAFQTYEIDNGSGLTAEVDLYPQSPLKLSNVKVSLVVDGVHFDAYPVDVKVTQFVDSALMVHFVYEGTLKYLVATDGTVLSGTTYSNSRIHLELVSTVDLAKVDRAYLFVIQAK